MPLSYLLGPQYNDITDLERDFFTLCANAQTYNEEASLIYEDSVRLRNVFIEIRRRYESGQNSDDSDDNDKGMDHCFADLAKCFFWY